MHAEHIETLIDAARAGDLRRILQPKRRILEALLESSGPRSTNQAAALEQLCVTTSDMLAIERCSIWRWPTTRERLICLERYSATTRKHETGLEISASALAPFFESLSMHESIAIDAVHQDPRTESLYKAGADAAVTGLLVVPIFSGRDALGVMMCEHNVEDRTWHSWEELVASSLADCAGIVLAVLEARRTNGALS